MVELPGMPLPPEFERQTPGAFVMLFRNRKFGSLNLRKQLQVLLVHRKDYDVWNLPGGGFEKTSEHPVYAAIREVREETGLEVTILKDNRSNGPVAVRVFSGPIDGPEFLSENDLPGDKRPDLFIVYIGVIAGGELKTSDEADQIQWFDIDKLPPNTYGKHSGVIWSQAGFLGEPRIHKAIQASTKFHKYMPESISE